MPQYDGEDFEALLDLRAAIETEAEREREENALNAEVDLEHGVEPYIKSGNPGWKPKKLSFSMAGTFEQCPRRWKYDYILGTRVGTPIPALIGSFAHEVLEYLYQEKPSERTIEAARDIAKFLWPTLEDNDHFVKHELTEAQAIEFKQKVWANIDGLFRMEEPQKIDVIATEQSLSIEINGVPFGGFVDRIDSTSDGVRIVDYKTGSPGAKTYWPKKLKQVQLYAALVREQLGITPTKVSLVFPSFQETIEGNVTKTSMTKVTNELGGVWHEIMRSMKEDDFPPKTGPLCAWCDHVGSCPDGIAEVKDRWAIGRVREDAPAVKILDLR